MWRDSRVSDSCHLQPTTTIQPSNQPLIRRDSRGSDSCHFNQQQPSNHLTNLWLGEIHVGVIPATSTNNTFNHLTILRLEEIHVERIPATSINNNHLTILEKMWRDLRGSDSCHLQPTTTIQPSNNPWEDVKRYAWEWFLPLQPTTFNHLTILEKMWRDLRGSDSYHFNQQQPFNLLTILEKMWRDSRGSDSCHFVHLKLAKYSLWMVGAGRMVDKGLI